MDFSRRALGHFCDRAFAEILSVECGEHGMPKAVCEELPSQGGRCFADAVLVALHGGGRRGVATAQRRDRRPVFSRRDRPRYTDLDQPCLLGVRYYLHSFLLSVPDVVYEESMLYYLQDL